VEAAVLAMRAAHPTWGGRKLRRVLENEGLSPPAASTITTILRRHGKLDGPGAGERRGFVRFEHAAPNDLWQMDFKGWFGLQAERCHPLTVLDDHSRFALELGACADEQAVTVRARLEAVFRRHGLPQRILADNGAPWGTGGLGAYSALGVWLMDLDIGLIHGRPYHPQTQGKDERFHRTLKLELLDRTVFADLGQAQAAFDAWREVYNTKRPHEAIGLHLIGIGLHGGGGRSRLRPPDPGPPNVLVQHSGTVVSQGEPWTCSDGRHGEHLFGDMVNRLHGVLAQVDTGQEVTTIA
jgi:transposase InsO family protein